jgi:murein DD-endopeptidase MepM/ murein hydrolase activator NlpD
MRGGRLQPRPCGEAVLLLLVAVALLVPAGSPAADFTLQRSAVTPSEAFFDSADGVRIEFRFSGTAQDVSVRIAGGGQEVRRIDLSQLQPGQDQVLTWDGLTDARKAAPDGTYRVLVGPPGSQLAEAGKVVLHGHLFPIRGPHGTRGAVGEFGAARNGGRIHRGFDATARCGTRLVAARGGTVVRHRFNPRLDGNFVVIRGFKENRTYRYSHLIRPSPLAKGDRVHTGDLVGHVGRTGNAASTPCHLHFELRKRSGRFLDPKPYLRAWDRYS